MVVAHKLEAASHAKAAVFVITPRNEMLGSLQASSIGCRVVVKNPPCPHTDEDGTANARENAAQGCSTVQVAPACIGFSHRHVWVLGFV